MLCSQFNTASMDNVIKILVFLCENGLFFHKALDLNNNLLYNILKDSYKEVHM